jgi:hypothetical protein
VSEEATLSSSKVSPEVKQIANGWHAGSQALNITADEARRFFEEAVRKAAELRARPAHFANPS